MKQIPLSFLVLSALFVTAALAFQGSDSSSSTRKGIDPVLHHHDASVEPVSPVTIQSTRQDDASTPESSPLKQGSASVKSVVKASSVDDVKTEDELPTDHIPIPSSSPLPPKTTQPTTPSPKTTPVTPPSTTPVPSTTTPSPKPSPTPTPSPPEYDWIVRGENGTICILAAMKVKLEYNINATQQVIPVPENATGTGHCGNNSQVLRLSWPNNTMTFSFSADNSTDSYYLSNIDVVSKLWPMNKTVKFTSKVKSFTTNLKSSYECTWSEPISGSLSNTSEVTEGQLKITMTDVHVEAFHNSTSDKYSLALVCQTDASDIVPVMVGIALAVLVLVVLIVYVIGRRNSQARGYLSM